MVTIFDMVTGEVIADETRSDVAAEARQPQHTETSLIAPRLQTVEEEAGTTEAHPGLPADLAQADIARFLGRQ